MLGATRHGRSAAARLLTASRLAPPSSRASHLISRSWQDASLPRPLRPSLMRSFSVVAPLRQQHAAVAEEASPTAYREFTQFAELAEHNLVSAKVIDTIVNRMNIHTMTDVQRMTINEALDGADIIAQAKTGTGKTLAFLMPIIQRILRDPSLEHSTRRRASAGDIRALIITPTRELAEQIAVEANKIVSGTAVRVQTAVGGTQKSYHLRKMVNEGCHILVGTPGRVKDILSDGYSGVKLDRLEAFVLDEADRLLDIGFAPDIAEIQSYMPPREQKHRQTMMFSATVPKEVVSLVRQTLRPDFKFVRTVDPDEAPTHERIPQSVVFCRGLENQLPAILEIATRAIEAHRRDPENTLPFKAIVYHGSTNEVTLAHQAFGNMRDPGSAAPGHGRMFAPHPLAPTAILEMHSRLTQQMRTRNSQLFREATSAILFSSDVTARGMDFPNVSHVIQIGLPRSPDDYVHRVGRTGRAGKSGEGWLLLTDDERSAFRRRMVHSGIKITENTDLQTAQLDMTQPSQLPAATARLMQMIESGIKTVPFPLKAQTYTSLLGVLGQGGGRDKQTTVNLMNDLARYGWGLEKPPGLDPKLVSRLGFGGVRGIEFYDRRPREGDDEMGGRGGGRRGGFNDRDPFGMGASSGTGAFRAGGEGGGFGGDRRGDRRAGFGGDRRDGFGGDRGGDRRGGFGGDRAGDRRSGGFGGDRRSGGFSGDRRGGGSGGGGRLRDGGGDRRPASFDDFGR